MVPYRSATASNVLGDGLTHPTLSRTPSGADGHR